MTIFDVNEKAEFIALQNFRYDNYSGYQYYLERVDVKGRCGLVCVEEIENCGTHAKVLLPPVYNDIQIRKISNAKANYDRYEIFANGRCVGQFTMVTSEWVTISEN